MTVAAAVFYIGEGVFNFGGADYKYGEKLPADVPAATITSLLEKGKASTDAPAREGKGTSNSELSALRDQVQDLTGQLNDARQELSEVRDAAGRNSDEIIRMQGDLRAASDNLTTVTGERDAALESLKQAQVTIEEMTRAQLAPPVEPVPAAPAGPKK